MLVSPGGWGAHGGSRCRPFRISLCLLSPRPPAPVSCGTAGAGEDEAPPGAAEVVEGPTVLPGKRERVAVWMGLVSSPGVRPGLQDGF